jgi:hypothetical protein
MCGNDGISTDVQVVVNILFWLMFGTTFLVVSVVLLQQQAGGVADCTSFNLYSSNSDVPYAYSWVSTPLSFSGARANCANKHPNSTLMIVRDSGGIDVLLMLTALTSSSTGTMAWIGLYQTSKVSEPAGNWVWVDGLPMDKHYLNWAPDRPNDNNNNEDCGKTNYVGSYDDGICTNTYGSFCEINSKIHLN